MLNNAFNWGINLIRNQRFLSRKYFAREIKWGITLLGWLRMKNPSIVTEMLYSWVTWYHSQCSCKYSQWTPYNSSMRVKYGVQNQHYNDIIMGAMPYQTTSLTIVYLTVYTGTGERKHQSSASLAFVRGIRQWPVNSPHKGPVMQKMFPCDDIIMDLNSTSVTFVCYVVLC